MEKVLIFTHVGGGILVLLTGLLIIVTKKGTKTHVNIGWLYVISMMMICFSAFSIMIFFRFSLFLFVVGLLTFNSTFNGVRVMRRKMYTRIPWYDYAVSIIVGLASIGLFTYGVYLVTSTNNSVLGGLSILFGVFTGLTARKDILFFWKGNREAKNWWLYQHIGSMGGSYIAAITAFAVQNGNLFKLGASLAWLPWVLPGVVGSIVLTKVIRKKRNKDSLA